MEEKDSLQENQPEEVSQNLAGEEVKEAQTSTSESVQENESQNQEEVKEESAWQEEQGKKKKTKKAEKEEKTSDKKEKKPRQPKEKKKTGKESSEVLSDDDLFAQIQTEKLLKRKRNKKIATLASLCAAFVLALAVVILAAVPVSLKPRCLQGSDLVDITLYGTNSAASIEISSEEDKAALEKFQKYFNQSFSQTCLSALFSGSLGDNIPDEKLHTEIKTPATTLKGDNYAGSGNYLVRFRFNAEHILTYGNGKNYVSTYKSSLWDGFLKFDEVFFVVNKDEGLKDTKVFVIASYPKFDNNRVQTGTAKYLVTVTVKADTSKLFNAWNEFTR